MPLKEEKKITLSIYGHNTAFNYRDKLDIWDNGYLSVLQVCLIQDTAAQAEA